LSQFGFREKETVSEFVFRERESFRSFQNPDHLKRTSHITPSLCYLLTHAHRSIGYRNHSPQLLTESVVKLMYLRVYDSRDSSRQPAPSPSLCYSLTHTHTSIGHQNRNPQLLAPEGGWILKGGWNYRISPVSVRQEEIVFLCPLPPASPTPHSLLHTKTCYRSIFGLTGPGSTRWSGSRVPVLPGEVVHLLWDTGHLLETDISSI
jgi:hypothetical protein